MTAEFSNEPAKIEPYLNPEYWGGEFTDTPQRWPTQEPSKADRQFAADCLIDYVKQGMNTDPLNTFYAGDTFTAGEHLPGTILLTFTEHLTVARGHQTQRPMSGFADTEHPAWRTAEDDELSLEGHGYRYVTGPVLNVVVRQPNSNPNLLVITKEELRTLPAHSYAANLDPGVRNFTVGKTYNFEGKTNKSLIRVNELYVCMFGSARQVKSRKT